MRKLKPTEITALAAALTIGSGNIEATETTIIATVTVTAGRIYPNVVPRFILPVGYVSGGGTPTNIGTTSSTLQPKHLHAISCAEAYGKSRGAVPKDGWATWFEEGYGWEMNLNVYTTVQNTPPGPGWTSLQGLTTPTAGSGPLGKTHIWLWAHSNTADLINTIAHEWAHQWGTVYTEAQAAAIGNNVEAAWLADAGRLCGGL